MYKKLTDQQPTIHPQLKGLRMTRQRREVYDVLMSHRDHPTASEVYEGEIEHAGDFLGDGLQLLGGISAAWSRAPSAF